MNLVKIADELYIPDDFEKNHSYFADADGTKPYTGITTILGVIAKPALIGWAARMACEHIAGNIQELIAADDDGRAKILEAARKAHSKKKDDAATKGTDVHALVENKISYRLGARIYDLTKQGYRFETEKRDKNYIYHLVETPAPKQLALV